MANGILTAAAAVTHTPQYQLDPQARQVLLSQAPSAQFSVSIDQQRNAFLAANGGCEFGYFDGNKTTN